ncbi:MAG: hypothetical protein PHU64_03645 [Candidatus Omnitrophica bacterium]|nr:hypothetical protein [Candidatus Omnitrophota bacterium]MDD5430195.1 hypothetical protein [Candidatus Omnitrophota bacterium]
MKKNINLSNLSEEDLLGLKIRDLPLSIEGSWLNECVQALYQELQEKNIIFRPCCYLADEWLAPDKEPVLGIPFFLAHPSLMKLERKMMLDVEGGTKDWCMKLLRHETGHAINYAYRFYRRRKWQKIFGQFSREYNETYRFRPYSRSFVRHLEDYYAQYHPDEDFAETFAVWLTPGLDWQAQYKGWRASDKLKYVEELMNEIKERPPLEKNGKKYWQASRINMTLRSFYKKKRHSYAEDFPDFHDSNLKRIFLSPEGLSSGQQKPKGAVAASAMVKKYKKEILKSVAQWTGERKYIIGDLLDTLAQRCRELGLILDKPEVLALEEVSIYVTTLVMNYLYTGGFRKNNCHRG